jgi:hypothetical protein
MLALPLVCLAALCFCGVCVAEDGKDTGIPSWAKVSNEQIAEAKKLGIPVAFENGFGVKFVLAPRGEFLMGSADDEVGRYPEEGPQHKVTIGKAYYISIHQTTQGQWKAAMGTTPWDGKRSAVNNPDHAINHVTWDDAMAFCAKLREKDGRSYRLPGEAEWEYACRAGTTTRYCYGDEIPVKADKPGNAARTGGRPIIDRLRPIPCDSGFRQDGYFVWCGALIRVGKQYHLFASRWPEGTGDPKSLVEILHGYRKHSEIVRATADNPIGPYKFQEVVLSGRGANFWDGQSCHGPKIVRVNNKFVLFYQGIARNSPLRKIGYAWADRIEGPWQRCDREIPLTEDANNPAPYVGPDGSVLLVYRTRELVMHMAKANAFDGDYKSVAENIFPAGMLEDPDLYFVDGQYHMIVEDNQGLLTGSARHGGHLVSQDGIRWKPHDPVKVYTHDLKWTDGTSWTATRRERPTMFNDLTGASGNGNPTHLITGVLHKGHSWIVVQEIGPE